MPPPPSTPPTSTPPTSTPPTSTTSTTTTPTSTSTTLHVMINVEPFYAKFSVNVARAQITLDDVLQGVRERLCEYNDNYEDFPTSLTIEKDKLLSLRYIINEVRRSCLNTPCFGSLYVVPQDDAFPRRPAELPAVGSSDHSSDRSPSVGPSVPDPASDPASDGPPKRSPHDWYYTKGHWLRSEPVRNTIDLQAVDFLNADRVRLYALLASM